MQRTQLPDITPISAPYWDAAKQHELLLPKCGACERFFFPPRAWCPHCYEAGQLGWETASGDGSILSFSQVHVPPFENYAETLPYVVAIVKLAEGPQLMANIIDCDPYEVAIGQNVRVTFEERIEGVSVPQFALKRANQ